MADGWQGGYCHEVQGVPPSGDWVGEPELDLFSSASLSAVEHVLSRRGALVFGWHYYYYGGGSRSCVRFHDFASYLACIETARPGDQLTLFDLDEIADQAFLREGTPDSSARLVFADDEWNDLRRRIEQESELVVVARRFVGPLTGTTQSKVEELWRPDDDEWSEFCRHFSWGLGEAMFFTEEVFDLDADGNQVSLVTAYPGRRINAVVDAKRPNSEGLVPLRGPY